MAFSLVPRARCRSIYDIDGAALANRGVRLLLLDLDNTISLYRAALPSENLRLWVAELRENGVEPYILSNSRKPTRVGDFAAALGVPFRRRAGKPKRAGFLAALEEMDVPREAAVMVGDQIFTDILGGNRAGIATVLVRPLALDTPFRLLRYGLETPFRRLAGPWTPERSPEVKNVEHRADIIE